MNRLHRFFTITLIFSIHVLNNRVLAQDSEMHMAIVSATSELKPIDLPLPSINIYDVAISNNNFRQGISSQRIVGGQVIQDDGTVGPAYAAFISSPNNVNPIDLKISSGQINSVAINDLNRGIIGGGIANATDPLQGPSTAYAAFVSSAGQVNPIELSLPQGSTIMRVAINNSNLGIVGGQKDKSSSTNGTAYAALAPISGAITPIEIPPSIIRIQSVAINNSNLGMIGGGFTTLLDSGSGPAYAATVSELGIATPIELGLSVGQILSVAINELGQGIVGGEIADLNLSKTFAYAALVFSPDNIIPIAIPPSIEGISSVAINKSNQGIIGGGHGGAPFSEIGPAYAAMVSESGEVTPIELSSLKGSISSVAINDFGQGIIVGNTVARYVGDFALFSPYAAIISPTGKAFPIDVSQLESLYGGAAINNSNQGIAGSYENVLLFLSQAQIPADGLSKNSLHFADYINQHSPQNAFYFVPTLLSGTLEEALMSVAPIQNGISTYTASNNLFYLTSGLSSHLIRKPFTPDIDKSSLLIPSCQAKAQLQPKYSFWFEAIGAIAFSEAQCQTVAFNPTTGGGMLALERQAGENGRIGAGVTYLYTHIHEKQGAGKSHTHQEDLFLYASWSKGLFYVNGSLLGGLFQTMQQRNDLMAGPDFKVCSSPQGWQLLPHTELGLNLNHWKPNQKVACTLNPFFSLDFANSWQKRFQEKGGELFTLGQKAHYSSLLRTEGSVRLYQTISFNCCSLTFQEKGGYVNKHSFGAGKVEGYIVGSSGSFTVETLAAAQNLGVASFGMTVTPPKTFFPASSVIYQGEFGKHYQSHQINLEMAWNF